MNPTSTTPRHLISKMLASLSLPADQTANPLPNATTHQRNILLTLHVLFPNELLPALDLLDRSLVSRVHLAAALPAQSRDVTSPPPPSAEQGPYSHDPARTPVIYHVRSAQAPARHTSAAFSLPTYEVRLRAWSCSCPAFAFAAFPAAPSSPAGGDRLRPSSPANAQSVAARGDDDDELRGTGFGGLTRGEDMPVCKHLLACMLVECGGEGFAGLVVEERRKTVEEIAGWAAGWGD